MSHFPAAHGPAIYPLPPNREYLKTPDGKLVKDAKGFPVPKPSTLSEVSSVVFTICEVAAQSGAGFATYPKIRAHAASAMVALVEAMCSEPLSDELRDILLGGFEGIADPLASVVANQFHGLAAICCALVRIGTNKAIEYVTTPRTTDKKTIEEQVTRHFLLNVNNATYRIGVDTMLPAAFGFASLFRPMMASANSSPATASRTSPAEGTYLPTTLDTAAVVNTFVGVVISGLSLVAARREGKIEWAPPPPLDVTALAKGYANRVRAGVKMATSYVRFPGMGDRIPVPVMALQSLIGAAYAAATHGAKDSPAAKAVVLILGSAANGLTHFERCWHWLQARNDIETPPAKWDQLIARSPEPLKSAYQDAKAASAAAVAAQGQPRTRLDSIVDALLPLAIAGFGGTAAMSVGETPWTFRTEDWEKTDFVEPLAELAVGVVIGLACQVAEQLLMPDPFKPGPDAPAELRHGSAMQQRASSMSAALHAGGMSGVVAKHAFGSSPLSVLGTAIASINPPSVTGFFRTMLKALSQTVPLQTSGRIDFKQGPAFPEGYYRSDWQLVEPTETELQPLVPHQVRQAMETLPEPVLEEADFTTPSVQTLADKTPVRYENKGLTISGSIGKSFKGGRELVVAHARDIQAKDPRDFRELNGMKAEQDDSGRIILRVPDRLLEHINAQKPTASTLTGQDKPLASYPSSTTTTSSTSTLSTTVSTTTTAAAASSTTPVTTTTPATSTTALPKELTSEKDKTVGAKEDKSGARPGAPYDNGSTLLSELDSALFASRGSPALLSARLSTTEVPRTPRSPLSPASEPRPERRKEAPNPRNTDPKPAKQKLTFVQGTPEKLPVTWKQLSQPSELGKYVKNAVHAQINGVQVKLRNTVANSAGVYVTVERAKHDDLVSAIPHLSVSGTASNKGSYFIAFSKMKQVAVAEYASQ